MGAPPFQTDIIRATGDAGEPIRIVAEGELDTASASQLRRAFQDALGSGPQVELTLDLAGLEFIDSTGLRALIEIEQEAARRGLVLSVVPAPEHVTELLQLAGVARRLMPAQHAPARPMELDFLERADLELPADHYAPASARATVREVLKGEVEDTVVAGAVLMTSELVTNAVLHSSAPSPSTVGLRVVVYPEFVRIEVDDAGVGFDPGEHVVEAPAIPGPGEGGRGLFVVDRSSARWGSRYRETENGPRFSVWFELETN